MKTHPRVRERLTAVVFALLHRGAYRSGIRWSVIVEKMKEEGECQRAVLGRWTALYDLVFWGNLGGQVAIYTKLAHVSMLFPIFFLIILLALSWADSRITAQGRLRLETNPLLREPRSEGEFL